MSESTKYKDFIIVVPAEFNKELFLNTKKNSYIQSQRAHYLAIEYKRVGTLIVATLL